VNPVSCAPNTRCEVCLNRLRRVFEKKKPGTAVFAVHIENLAAIGYDRFQQFMYVVQLNENMRQNGDPAFFALLTRLRHSVCTWSDVAFLNAHVLGPTTAAHIDFAEPAWHNATAISPRNLTSYSVGLARARAKALGLGVRPIVILARDFIVHGDDALVQPSAADRAELWQKPAAHASNCDGMLVTFPGMRVRLTAHVDGLRRLGCVNGAEGELVSILPHHLEPPFPHSDGSTVPYYLRYTPEALLIRLDRDRLPNGDEQDRLIPICPRRKQFEWKPKQGRTLKVSRGGFRLTDAGSITEIKSQGMTIPKALLDLRLPRGYAQAASPYVQLSRVPDSHSFALLQPVTLDDVNRLRPPQLRLFAKNLYEKSLWTEQQFATKVQLPPYPEGGQTQITD
jgi:hypothetical protein